MRALAIYRERGSVDAAVDEAIRPAPARPLTDAERQWLISPKFSPHVFIETDRGVIELELAILDAPFTVANFVGLARRNFFDGIAIHRIVADFVVQDGDPRGTARVAPATRFGTKSTCALICADSRNGTRLGGYRGQPVLHHALPQPHLDGRYTVMGCVERYGCGRSAGPG